ncbi:hypothetical protein WJX74_007342 [Apatococcus lobatus]|uniref:SAP domain-containing protein n=1 Tax=Apatococcus lobatus TaxID=904363 RepID=A0AAW1RHZ9_9CHLO
MDGQKSQIEVEDIVRGLLLKDLRVQCRARGISPAGSRDALLERLRDDMLQTQDYSLHAEGANQAAAQAAAASYCNNYTRPEGQNVGNHITGRPSSRVLAPPGGGSQIFFGNEEPQAQPAMMPKSPVHQENNSPTSNRGHFNNYHRPGGQNVGNFITDKASSRVLAPPGGASQITFG